MSTVNISERAELMAVVYQELQEIEKLQLRVGEDMAKLMFEQIRLGEKSRALLMTLERAAV
jgi:hypothetical protein